MLKVAGHQRCRILSHAARALCSISMFLVVILAGSLPVFGATRGSRPDPRIDYLATDGSSCAITKILQVGRLSLRHPVCWALSSYPSDTFVSYILLGVLSNQLVHNPCSTTHSATGSTTRCGYPLRTLKRGGVLIMLNIGSASGSGRHFDVDHRAARESVTRNPPGVPKDQRLLDQMLGSMKIE